MPILTSFILEFDDDCIVYFLYIRNIYNNLTTTVFSITLATLRTLCVGSGCNEHT